MLIGLATALLMLLNGRIAGISGIVGGLVARKASEVGWRATFAVGLLLGAVAYVLATGGAFPVRVEASLPVMVAAGLLVGLGTLRDTLFLLDGLLENKTGLEPKEITSDTAGYSDVIFGLFALPGYQFSPRLANAGQARFWRIDKRSDYGPLDGLAGSRIDTTTIEDNWEDLLRVAGSLKLGTVTASEFVRTIQAPQRTSTLAGALASVGHVAKSLFLLSYVDDEAYRRKILVQLNRHEKRHNVARKIFYGQREAVRKRYREGRENQLGALGLVVNAVALWNTFYLDQAVEHLREQGVEAREVDLARVLPLARSHINVLGRYHFMLDESVVGGGIRPLRDPTEINEFEIFAGP